MKKERKNIILIAVAAVMIIVLAIGFRLLNRTSYNDENTLGNTSSNLLNGGLFCEIDDKIYFGELTFSPCGGFMPFEPRKADEEVGRLLELPCSI